MIFMRIKFTRIAVDALTTKLGRCASDDLNIRLIPYDPKKARKLASQS